MPKMGNGVDSEAAMLHQPAKPSPNHGVDSNQLHAHEMKSSRSGDDDKQWMDTVQTGDLVLFNRRCQRMSPEGAIICLGAKYFLNTKWDHVGMVVRVDGRPCLLEATMGGGVVLRPLDVRIAKSSSYDIALRRLQLPPRPSDDVARGRGLTRDQDGTGVAGRPGDPRTVVEQWAKEMVGAPYPTLGKVVRAALTPTQRERQYLTDMLVTKTQELAAVEREQQRRMGLLARRMLEAEREALAVEIASLRRSLDDKQPHERPPVSASTGPSRGTYDRVAEPGEGVVQKGVYCSELVALALQRMRVLPQYPSSESYTPKSFSSDGAPLVLTGEASLAREEFIRGSGERGWGWLGSWTADTDASTYSISRGNSSLCPNNALGMAEEPSDEAERTMIREVLRRNMITARLGEDARERLVAGFRKQTFGDRERVLLEGETGDCFFILAAGECDVVSTRRGRFHAHKVATLRPGSSFGEQSFLFNVPRSATVKARGDVTVWRMDRLTMERFGSAHADMSTTLRELGTDVRWLNNALQTHPLLAPAMADERRQQAVLQSFFKVKFKKGETVVRAGESADNFYVVLDGRLVERCVSPFASHSPPPPGDSSSSSTIGDGHAATGRTEWFSSWCWGAGNHQGAAGQSRMERGATVTPLGSGDWYGDVEVLYDLPRGGDVVALEDTTVWAINRHAFAKHASDAGSLLLNKFFDHAASVTRRRDGARAMTRSDFLQLMRRLWGREMAVQDERLAMRLADPLGTGHITLHDFATFDCLLNCDVLPRKVLLRLLDPTDSGTVCYRDLDDVCGATIAASAAAAGLFGGGERDACDRDRLVSWLGGGEAAAATVQAALQRLRPAVGGAGNGTPGVLSGRLEGDSDDDGAWMLAGGGGGAGLDRADTTGDPLLLLARRGETVFGVGAVVVAAVTCRMLFAQVEANHLRALIYVSGPQPLIGGHGGLRGIGFAVMHTAIFTTCYMEVLRRLARGFRREYPDISAESRTHAASAAAAASAALVAHPLSTLRVRSVITTRPSVFPDAWEAAAKLRSTWAANLPARLAAAVGLYGGVGAAVVHATLLAALSGVVFDGCRSMAAVVAHSGASSVGEGRNGSPGEELDEGVGVSMESPGVVAAMGVASVLGAQAVLYPLITFKRYGQARAVLDHNPFAMLRRSHRPLRRVFRGSAPMAIGIVGGVCVGTAIYEHVRDRFLDSNLALLPPAKTTMRRTLVCHGGIV